MVTRAFAAQNIRNTTREIGAFRSTVTGTILPVLGLSAAMGFLSGGFNDATASGRIASSATYGLQIAMYGLQDAITRALLPAIEAITPRLVDAVNWFVDLNEQTNGWATNIALAAGAAYLARGPISALYKIGRFGVGAAGGAAGIGTGTVVAAGAAGAAGLGLIAGTAITGNYGPARAVDETLNTEAIGQTVQGALPYEPRPLEGGLFENAARFYRQATIDLVQGPLANTAIGQAAQLDTNEIADSIVGAFGRFSIFPQQQPLQQSVIQQPAQQPTTSTRTVVINAPGVFDTDGLIRRMQELLDNGSLRLD